CAEPVRAFLEHEAADLAVVRVRLRPDDEHVGDRRVGDPHLGARKHVAALHLLGAGAHAAGVGAGVGLSQAEAADPFAGREPGQILLALLLRTVGADRVHDEARLDRHGRAVAAVDALHRAGDQAVADVAEAGAAIFGGNGRAEQPECAHLAHDLAVEALVEIGRGHPRQELLLRVAFGGVADQPLLVVELVIEIERVRPVERKDGRLAHGVAAPKLSRKRPPLPLCGAARHPRRQSFLATFAPPPLPNVCLSVRPTLMCWSRSRNSLMISDGSARLGRNSRRLRLPNTWSTLNVTDVLAAGRYSTKAFQPGAPLKFESNSSVRKKVVRRWSNTSKP